VNKYHNIKEKNIRNKMYLNKCKAIKCPKSLEPTYIFSGPCVISKKIYSVKIKQSELEDYCFRNKPIQEAFPDMSIDDREFIISGISPNVSWEKLFPE
jgi:hypothetical protein